MTEAATAWRAARDPVLQLACSEAQLLGACGLADRIVETRGFRVHLWTEPDTFYRNVAVPTVALPDWAPAVAAMAAVFHRERRQPSVEFAAERWPLLGSALERAGFARDAPLTAMAHDGVGLGPVAPLPPATRLRRLDGATPLPVLHAYLARLHGTFDARRPVTVGLAEAAGLQRALARGRTRISVIEDARGAAIAGGNLVGITELSGIAGPPHIAGPVAELAGVWVDAAVRGQGLARSLVDALLAPFFAAGGHLVWLATDDRLALGLYAGLGFRPIGRLLRYSLPTT